MARVAPSKAMAARQALREKIETDKPVLGEMPMGPGWQVSAEAKALEVAKRAERALVKKVGSSIHESEYADKYRGLMKTIEELTKRLAGKR